jgi:hypothetical protein
VAWSREGHDLHDAAVDLADLRAGSIMGTPELSAII